MGTTRADDSVVAAALNDVESLPVFLHDASGRLLSTVTLSMSAPWEQARHVMQQAIVDGVHCEFRFNYVTTSLVLASDSSWMLCKSLWRAKGASAKRTLTVSHCNLPYATEVSQISELSNEEVHVVHVEPIRTDCSDTCCPFPQCLSTASSSPLCNLKGFASIFDENGNTDTISSQPEEQTQPQTLHRVPPKSTQQPRQELLKHHDAPPGSEKKEKPHYLQITCRDNRSGDLLFASPLSIPSETPYDDMLIALKTAVEAKVGRTVIALHFPSPSGGLFELDGEMPWKLCKGLAAATGTPSDLVLTVSCGGYSAGWHTKFVAADESVRLASAEICKEIRSAPWYEELEQHVHDQHRRARLHQHQQQHSSARHRQHLQPLPPHPHQGLRHGTQTHKQSPCQKRYSTPVQRSPVPTPLHAATSSLAIVNSPPPFITHESKPPSSLTTGESVTPDLSPEEMQRLEDIRAQMRAMVSALG